MSKKLTLEGIETIILDIEGTISDIQFVKNVLFPYSREKLPSFLKENSENPKVQEAVNLALETAKDENLDGSDIEALFLSWIDSDRKHPALKSLQGMIWKEGFESKTYQSHLYDEVPEVLKTWRAKGLRLGIYSSGSVGAQKLFFAHTVFGDLLSLFDFHFDLDVGGKKEASSYRNISEQIKTSPDKTLFFTDVEEEKQAALTAGWKAFLVDREDQNSDALHSLNSLTLK